MKLFSLAATALLGTASAFAPAAVNQRGTVAVQAEQSKALPFMNRPPLVSNFSWLVGLCIVCLFCRMELFGWSDGTVWMVGTERNCFII